MTPEGALRKLQVAADPGLQSPWPGLDPQGLQGPLKGLNLHFPPCPPLLSPSVGCGALSEAKDTSGFHFFLGRGVLHFGMVRIISAMVFHFSYAFLYS